MLKSSRHWKRGVTIFGFQKLLEPLFLNLMTNAATYSFGYEIRIALFKKSNEIIFTIENERDNDMLDIEKIWMSFYVEE